MPLRYLIVFLFTLPLLGCSTGPVTFFPSSGTGSGGVARVIVPGPITVRSIDGTEVKAPSQETGSYELHMEPGHHLIAFQYILWWGTDMSGSMVRSKLTGVDAQFEAGKVYELTYNVPRDEYEADKFRNKFTATLIEPTSGLKVESYPIGDLGSMLVAKNITRVTPGAPVTPAPAATTTATADTVKQLQYWWHIADEKERKQFTEWMKSATETFSPPQGAESAVKTDTLKQLKYWWLKAEEKERQQFTEWMAISIKTPGANTGK